MSNMVGIDLIEEDEHRLIPVVTYEVHGFITEDVEFRVLYTESFIDILPIVRVDNRFPVIVKCTSDARNVLLQFQEDIWKISVLISDDSRNSEMIHCPVIVVNAMNFGPCSEKMTSIIRESD